MTDRLIHSTPHGPVTVTVEDIDQVTAKTWLAEFNTRNRKQQDPRVLVMASDMEAGSWIFAGGTVLFATDDETGEPVLIDGQHRLRGVELSGETQTFIVVRGLPLIAQEVVDTGRVRTVGDQLNIDKIPNGTNIAAISRRVQLWENGLVSGLHVGGGGISGGKVPFSKGQQLVYVREHLDELQASMKVVKGLTRNGFTVPSTVVAAAWVLLHQVDETDADLFIVDNLIGLRGLGDKPGHPAVALRQRLTRTDRWKPTAGEAFLLILKAWNHYRDGERIEKLQSPRDGWSNPGEFRIR